MELEKLKYVNRTEKDWILGHNQLEFTLRLAEGTSGTIYKGLFKSGEVAIKVLKTDQSEKEKEEFKKEFQIMSSIQHENLVFFFGAALEPKLCMVMELCLRGSLYDVLSDKKLGRQIDWHKFFSFAIHSVRGVQVLHNYEPQILHRDLKSLNLLVNKDFKVKVGDFGLARFNTDSQNKTLVACRGTYSYTAPEVFKGEKFSVRSDIFSIAVILWEMVTRIIIGSYRELYFHKAFFKNSRFSHQNLNHLNIFKKPGRPYSEFPNLKNDYAIINQTSKQGLRNTIHQHCPESLTNLIKRSWSGEEAERPDCQELLEILEKIKIEFEANGQEWEYLMETS